MSASSSSVCAGRELDILEVLTESCLLHRDCVGVQANKGREGRRFGMSSDEKVYKG